MVHGPSMAGSLPRGKVADVVCTGPSAGQALPPLQSQIAEAAVTVELALGP